MVTKKRTKSGIEYEQGSGNIYADLGFPDADERFARSTLAIQIIKILKERGIEKQKDRAEALGISKTEMSQLTHGNFERFSEGRLIGFLNKLNYRAVTTIVPMKKGEIPHEVVMM